MNDLVPTQETRVDGSNGALAIPAAPTAEQARVTEVNAALLRAYEQASRLELSDAEIAALMQSFPDEVVSILPFDGNLYLAHILIRRRLNEVFRPGKWALIRRRAFSKEDTIYGEYVLLVRGVYVGETISGHAYVPSNKKTDYADALESTAGDAIRRIAAKAMSCGDQVWNPEFCRQWKERWAEQAVVNGKMQWRRRSQPIAADPGEPDAGPDVERANGNPVDDAPVITGQLEPTSTAVETITGEQASELESLWKSLPNATQAVTRIADTYQIDGIRDLPAAHFQAVKMQLAAAAPISQQHGPTITKEQATAIAGLLKGKGQPFVNQLLLMLGIARLMQLPDAWLTVARDMAAQPNLEALDHWRGLKVPFAELSDDERQRIINGINLVTPRT